MTVFNNHRYTNVALPKETHKLVKHVARSIDATLPETIAAAIKLLQQKLGIEDPRAD